MKNLYSRKTTRIPGFDYSSQHHYFITICTHEHRCIFGKPNDLNGFGKIAEEHISRITAQYPNAIVDKYVVMPNHIHVILALTEENNNPDITMLIGLYKAGVTKQIRQFKPGIAVWQRSFHDHIIRGKGDYEKIWTYIDNNPLQWKLDRFYREG